MGRKSVTCVVPQPLDTYRYSTTGGLKHEAPPLSEAGRCICDCVLVATEQSHQAFTAAEHRTGQPYGAPLRSGPKTVVKSTSAVGCFGTNR